MRLLIKLSCIFTGLLFFPKTQAAPPVHLPPCASAQSAIDQQVNNVRQRLAGGGDLWWAQPDGGYVIPQSNPVTGDGRPVSLFKAGGIWMAGLDPAGNLKMACQYPYSGNPGDFWPGPLQNGATTVENCAHWDRHFRVTRSEIIEHLHLWGIGGYSANDIPAGVKGWPARGNPFFSEVHQFNLPGTTAGLAAFFDKNGDDIYNPLDGDYPRLNVHNSQFKAAYPEEIVFWIFNDEGGGAQHGTSKGWAIKTEIQATSFVQKNGTDLDDLSFRHYRVIHRGSDYIDSAFFSLWIDPQLGCIADDYIGYSPFHQMAYVYNMDAQDGNADCTCPPDSPAGGFCDKIPMAGVKLVYAGAGQGIPTTDPWAEDTSLTYVSSFTYFVRQSASGVNPVMSAPELPAEFYNYMTGSWRDGTFLTKGGNGYQPGSTLHTSFAFPDAPNDATGWSMCTATMPQADYQMLLNTRTGLMDVGSVRDIVYAFPYATSVQHPCPDLHLLLQSAKAADLYFMEGIFEQWHLRPVDPPEISWAPLSRQLVAKPFNTNYLDNNRNEGYRLYDFLSPDSLRWHSDSLLRASAYYWFEGYKLYQLVNPGVKINELNDPAKARLVRQADIENDVSSIYNWFPYPNPASPDDPRQSLFQPVEMVEGANLGIPDTFLLSEDLFATGPDRRLVNYHPYYYAVLAYSNGNFGPFHQVGPHWAGQRTPYQQSWRMNIYTATPYPPGTGPLEAVELWANPSGNGPVRLTQVPDRCAVTVYNSNGAPIRRFERNVAEGTPTIMELPLNGSAAPGIYFIHIDGYERGQRTLKCVLAR